MSKKYIYDGDGYEAPLYVIDAVLGTKIGMKDESRRQGNSWRWKNKQGAKRLWQFVVYVEDEEAINKIIRNENIKPLAYRYGGMIYACEFTTF